MAQITMTETPGAVPGSVCGNLYPVIGVKVNTRKLKLGRKEVGEAIAYAYEQTLRYWHRQMLPEHFKPSAVNKYGYAKRTKKYQIYKAKKKHHQRPLVWSGDLKYKAQSVRDIRSSSRQGKLVMRDLPRYTYMYRVSKPVHKAEELVATTDKEEKALRRIFEEALVKKLNTMNTGVADIRSMGAGVVNIQAA